MIGGVATGLALAVGAGGGWLAGNFIGKRQGTDDAAAFAAGELSQTQLLQRRESVGSMAMFSLGIGGLATAAAGVGALFTGHPLLIAATGLGGFGTAFMAGRATSYEKAVDPVLQPTLPKGNPDPAYA